MGIVRWLGAMAFSLALGGAAWAQDEPAMTPQQVADASNALALSLGDALRERCRVDAANTAALEAPYLEIIANETLDANIEVIANALAGVSQDTALCTAARSALSAALQSSQLAQAASDAATGAINDGNGAPFAAGGPGAPGGGGGGGYVNS